MSNKIISELKKYNEVYNKDIKEDKLMEAYNAFGEQGHSGFSASYAINYLSAMFKDPVKTEKMLNDMLNKSGEDDLGMQTMITGNIMEIYNIMKDTSEDEKDIIVKLLRHEPITPILGTDDEWKDVSWKEDNYTLYQNKRCSSVFKNVYPNGLSIAYSTDDKSYSEDGGISWFTTNSLGRTQISFPYEPKTENVYIYEPEDGGIRYILTDEATIAQLKAIKRERQ